MGLRDTFKTSPKLETEGIDLDLGFAIIKLARAGGSNQKYNAAVAKMYSNYKRALELDALSDDKARALLIDIYAKHVILDWHTKVGETNGEPVYERGIEGEDGELLPFNEANVIATLTDLPELFASQIKPTAEGLQFFRQSLLDAAAKN